MSAEPAARRATVVAVFVVVAVAVAGVIVALATKREPRLAGTNAVDEQQFVAVIRRQRFCQTDELVPAGTAAVRLLIGTYGRLGPPLDVLLRPPGDDAAPAVTEGRLRRGWTQGHVTVPVRRVDRATPATICVQASSPHKIAIAGVPAPQRRAGKAIRVEYLRAGTESYVSLMPTIADRYGRGKSRWEGSWALVLTGLLILTSLLLAARRMLAEGRW